MPLIRHLAAVAVLGLATHVAPADTPDPAAGATADRPNVVVMLADNMGFGDLGAYGSGGEIRGMPTPRIDALASEGLMLTQFFVEPGCTPSRAALMTGRYSPRAGLGSIIVAGTPSTLQAGEHTLAEMFKSKGYTTGMAGKWHLGAEKQSIPINQGFDEYKVGIIETTDGTMYPDSMRRTGLPEEMIEAARPWIWESVEGEDELRKVRPYDLEYRRQVEADIADYAVDFIEREAGKDEPFFLYVGWSHCHYPGLCHPDFEGRSGAGPYGDMVMELDHRTGQVLDAIDRAGIADDTIVLWLADNGPVQIQVGDGDYMGSSPGPFRGEVGDALEGSLRVPAMVRWPDRIPARRSNEMVAIHDLLPTLASIVDAELPTDRPIDGADQAAFFLGEVDRSARDSYLTFIDGEVAAVRWKQWRIYPRQFVESGGTPSTLGVGGHRADGVGYPAVFNIERDPHETWNVVGTNAWVLGPYMKIVKAYRDSLKDHPNPPAFSMTDFGN